MTLKNYRKVKFVKNWPLRGKTIEASKILSKLNYMKENTKKFIWSTRASRISTNLPRNSYSILQSNFGIKKNDFKIFNQVNKYYRVTAYLHHNFRIQWKQRKYFHNLSTTKPIPIWETLYLQFWAKFWGHPKSSNNAEKKQQYPTQISEISKTKN